MLIAVSFCLFLFFQRNCFVAKLKRTESLVDLCFKTKIDLKSRKIVLRNILFCSLEKIRRQNNFNRIDQLVGKWSRPGEKKM